VGERERRRARPRRHRRGLARRRVTRLGGALAGVVRERRVVNQEVRALGGGHDGVVGPGVARVDESPAGPGVADDLLRADDRAVFQFDGLAVVELRELRADRHAQFLGALPVEAARPLVLQERVPHGRGPVVGRERPHLVLRALEDRLPRAHLVDPHGVPHVAPDGEQEVPDAVAEPPGDVDG